MSQQDNGEQKEVIIINEIIQVVSTSTSKDKR